MATPIIFRRILIYGILSLGGIAGISQLVTYEWLRSYGPRQPIVETGHIYPMRMQQPFDVYLTKFQQEWIDSGVVVGLVLFGVAFYLNSRWKIIQNTPYDGLLGKKKY
jgi:hypothetical protein